MLRMHRRVYASSEMMRSLADKKARTSFKDCECGIALHDSCAVGLVRATGWNVCTARVGSHTRNANTTVAKERKDGDSDAEAAEAFSRDWRQYIATWDLHHYTRY